MWDINLFWRISHFTTLFDLLCVISLQSNLINCANKLYVGCTVTKFPLSWLIVHLILVFIVRKFLVPGIRVMWNYLNEFPIKSIGKFVSFWLGIPIFCMWLLDYQGIYKSLMILKIYSI